MILKQKIFIVCQTVHSCIITLSIIVLCLCAPSCFSMANFFWPFRLSSGLQSRKSILTLALPLPPLDPLYVWELGPFCVFSEQPALTCPTGLQFLSSILAEIILCFRYYNIQRSVWHIVRIQKMQNECLTQSVFLGLGLCGDSLLACVFALEATSHSCGKWC